jgi:glyoxylase-like metal-dependent hydrolase (beta-lactamase superfamily II)
MLIGFTHQFTGTFSMEESMKNRQMLGALAVLGVALSAQAGQIYVFESDAQGFNTKNYFYDTGEEVVAFDAQFTNETAEKSIAFLRSKTRSPLTYIVVTHPSPDKFNGLEAFRKAGAKIVMSERAKAVIPSVHAYKKYYFVNMAKMFTEEFYPSLQQPDITFSGRKILALKGGSIDLRELAGSAVSINHVVAYIPERRVLVVGDILHPKVHAWLEGPIVEEKTAYSTEKWVKTLQELKDLHKPDVTVYPGRGEAAPLGQAVDAQIHYLREAERITRRYVNALTGIGFAAEKKVDYIALTKVFETTFPDYGLSYMVTYGAYGLVNSLR